MADGKHHLMFQARLSQVARAFGKTTRRSSAENITCLRVVNF
jgi:hypothetical protein